MEQYKNVIEKIKSGAKLRAFLSGGGLRVVRVEQNHERIGYGEHPQLSIALERLEEDISEGQIPYDVMYGERYPQYWTGSSNAESFLDAWLLQGSKFAIWMSANTDIFSVEMIGYVTKRVITPEVEKKVKDTMGPVQHEYMGFFFESRPYEFPNGEIGVSTKILKRPEVSHIRDPFFYKEKYKAEGASIIEALEKITKEVLLDFPGLEIYSENLL